MSINTDLNISPYYDDFENTKQYYRVLFKPRYAVQSRELNQLQAVLQNQIEQFGDHSFQEGSIIKGCNITYLNNIKYVRLADKASFDVNSYLPSVLEDGSEIYYTLTGTNTELKADIIAADRGFETRFPNLNTFYINYLNSSLNTSSVEIKIFESGELLKIKRVTRLNDVVISEDEVATINVATSSGYVGDSFGIIVDEGVVYQKGHFLYADEQLVIVSKYNKRPDEINVGFEVKETIVDALKDNTLFDNANGSPNRNGPGADRLKLTPVLTVLPEVQAEQNANFFAILRFKDGLSITTRETSSFNAINEKMARRTFEESGNYVVEKFNTNIVDGPGGVNVQIGYGVAYSDGHRVEHSGQLDFLVDQIAATETQLNQGIGAYYGRYVKVISINGNINIGSFVAVSLRNASNTQIGTAIVTNFLSTKVYLTDILMNVGSSFNQVDRIVDTAASGYVRITPKIIQTTKSPKVIDIGMFSIKSTNNISMSVREKKTVNITTNPFTITADVGETIGEIEGDDVGLIVVTAGNVYVPVSTYSTVVGGISVTLTSPTLPMNSATIYYNKRITVQPYSLLKKEPYIRINYTYATKIYNLGFPNVLRILSIVDAAGNNYSRSFYLNRNQKDDYYDHSYIKFAEGKAIPPDGILTIKLRVLEVNSTTGSYFFTSNSYPVDLIRQDIPSYLNVRGDSYDLRDCIDFRPYTTKISNANYNFNTPVGAPIIAPNVDLPANLTGTQIVPANDTLIKLDYEYYLNRTDIITMDSYGKMSYVKGQEDKNSKPSETDKLVICEVYVPGFPAISTAAANLYITPNHSVRFKSIPAKTYTMKDIDVINKKVESLSRYTVLNALEKEMENLDILDSSGLSRYKNAIIVDTFDDLSMADIRDNEFTSALDFTEKTIIPKVNMTPLNLKVKSFSNASLHPDSTTPKTSSMLKNANIVIIKQPNATNFRNCANNYYSFKGVGFIHPEYEPSFDTTITPNININSYVSGSPWNFTMDPYDISPMTSTKTEVLLKSIENQNYSTGEYKITSTGFTSQKTVNQLQLSKDEFEGVIGDFATNLKFIQYAKPAKIRVLINGLRPNTIHYPFCNNLLMSLYCAPGTITENPENIQKNGAYNDPIVSNSSGVACFVFNLPPSFFFVGDLKIQLADVNTAANISSVSSSYGFVTYRSYNFKPNRLGFTASTRAMDTSNNKSSTTKTIVDRQVVTNNLRSVKDSERVIDPITQTFYIKETMCNGSDSLYISKLDLYFRRKSATHGITIELREVINGFPSTIVLPFSRVHIPSASINTSVSGQSTTVATFKSPVKLDSEKEYSFSIIPDAGSPDFLIFTGKTGKPNISNGSIIAQDWGEGVLYTTTNNRSWQPVQGEDIKFTLYRNNYVETEGTVTLTNRDHEFISINTQVGNFRLNEMAYSIKQSTGDVNVIYGSNVINRSGSFDLSTIYAVGDYVLLVSAADRELYKVSNVTAAALTLTANVCLKTSTNAPFTGTIASSAVVVGRVVDYNQKRNDELVLEDSSAKIGRIFAAATQIAGIESRATANISSVNNVNLGYIQPMINKIGNSDSTVSMTGVFTDIINTSTNYSMNIAFNDSTKFGQKGMVLFSKSNGISSPRPFDFVIKMKNTNEYNSPIIDVETACIFAYRYNITNISETTSKFISRIIELPDSSDAEDFLLYVSAYIPRNSKIKAYIKIQNSADFYNFDSCPWLELDIQEGQHDYSSDSNYFDFKRLLFAPRAANKISDSIVYTAVNGTTFSQFKRISIKIELLSTNNYQVPRLRDYRGVIIT